MKNNRILVTGSAGFIGFHLSKLLLSQGFEVHGYDGLTEYYDVSLKKERHKMLSDFSNFSNTIGMLEDKSLFENTFKNFNPDIVIHLAAQAGVRYSLENPRAYIDSNIIGTFNVMESARINNVSHLLMASTSSVYGDNNLIPFKETHKADEPLSFYGATKKSCEVLEE